MKIGVIADTHDHFDPKIPKLFAGVDHILHGGDIGLPWIILELEQIAPVTAVLGNNDTGLDLKETEIVLLGSRKFLVHHIVDVRTPAESVRALLEKQRPDVVVFGHSHKPHSESIGQTLFLNPGYAGKSRFNLPRSVALLHLEGAGLRTEFMPLP